MRAESFATPDGVRLVYDDDGGESRPTLLIHGFLSSARINWRDYGTADLLAEAGLRPILPDLRGHGRSDAPLDAAAYPPDILSHDLASLIAHLNISDGGYDLVGYSLGARAVLRGLVLGLKPRRAVIAGMGLTGIIDAAPRIRWFQRALVDGDKAPPGAPERLVARFRASTKTDALAAHHVLASHVDTPLEALAGIETPILVLAGAADNDNGSAAALARALPYARFQSIPGDHMSAITRPEFAVAIRDFLL